MHNTIDITGQRFGRLTAIARAPRSGTARQARWLFRCDCGTEKAIPSYNVRHGITQSCGCIQREVTSARAKTMNLVHGASRSPDWNRWQSMIRRCDLPTDKAYKNYGARGITVCDRWRGPEGFINYLADMGPRPTPAHTVERVDNDTGYRPENCVWATRAQQLRNRRTNIPVEWNGVTKLLCDWARDLAINTGTLSKRWHRGDRGERLFRKPDSRFRSHPATVS